jgi:hypothetical protein
MESSMNVDTIALHVEHLAQLFDALDPSPLRERDLSPRTEQYIVESIKELRPRAPQHVLVHVNQPLEPTQEAGLVAEAVRNHFVRQSNTVRQELRQLLRHGGISLAIGLAFMATVLLIGRALAPQRGVNTFAALVSESLVIGGWVAMWRPLEIFLYDWWPIVGRRRLYERLSRIEVKVLSQSRSS